MEKLETLKTQVSGNPKPDAAIGDSPQKRFSFFRFSSTPSKVIPAPKVPAKEPLLKGVHLSKTSGKLAAIEKWVDLEEKIVHGYKRQQIPAPSLGSPEKSRKSFSLFRFSSTPSKVIPVTPNVSPKEAPKGVPRGETNGGLAAIEKRMDLEEKIVSEYRGQRIALPKSTPPLSIASSVTYTTGLPTLKKSSSGTTPFRYWDILIWGLGLVLAGFLVFLYIRELPLKQDVSHQIAGILEEKSRLEQSYKEAKTVSGEQKEKLQQQSLRIQRMNGELRMLREKAVRADRLEKTYRQELMRITTDYEIQLDALRASLRTKDEIVTALKAQMKAIEQMIDRGTLSAVSGAASLVARQASFGRNEALQGKVTQVNFRQGYFVVNIGSELGARSGVPLKVYRDGVLVGDAVADRVYPTMSSVTMLGRTPLYTVREGDFVSF